MLSRTEHQKHRIETLRYLESVEQSQLSWMERKLLQVPSLSDHERDVGYLVASLRRRFFDKEYSEFLETLGMFRLGGYRLDQDYADTLIVQTVHDEMMKNAEHSYWLRASRERSAGEDSALSSLVGGYCVWFRTSPYLLRYILGQGDPLSLVETLEQLSEARLSEMHGVRNDAFYLREDARGAIILQLVQGIWETERSNSAPDGLMDLSYDVMLELIGIPDDE